MSGPWNNFWFWVESIASISGLVSVFFERNRHIFVYPTGLLSVFLYIILCYRAGLYADALINIYYTIMCVYGWILWGKFQNSSYQVPILKGPFSENIKCLFFTLLIWVILWYWLKFNTDSTVPVLDSFTTSASVIGMWLLAKRKIENWYYWIAVNTISVPLFAIRGLYLTAFQFIVLWVLSFSGYRLWEKEYTQSELIKLSK